MSRVPSIGTLRGTNQPCTSARTLELPVPTRWLGDLRETRIDGMATASRSLRTWLVHVLVPRLGGMMKKASLSDARNQHRREAA